MSAKYLTINANGDTQEVEVIESSSGAGDAGKAIGLNSEGLLDDSMLNAKAGYEANKVVIIKTTPTGKIDSQFIQFPDSPEEADIVTASEALLSGDWVNIHSVGGAAKARKAVATDAGKRCNGFVLENYAVDAANVKVWRESQLNNKISGLVPGEVQFLSCTQAGKSQNTPPTGSNQIVQKLGVASGSTTCIFAPEAIIVRA